MRYAQIILILSQQLRKLGQNLEADRVQDLAEYEEPWHEEAVKEFGADPISEEEYLEREISAPLSPYGVEDYLPYLKELGITPLSVGEKGLLGMGAFGIVVPGVYQGKPVAVKLQYASGASDVDAWKKINQIRKKMPANLKKHLPEVYLATRVPTGEVTVMEPLLPLTSEVRSMITGRSAPSSRIAEAVAKEYDKRKFQYFLSQHFPQKNPKAPSTEDLIFQVLKGRGLLNEDGIENALIEAVRKTNPQLREDELKYLKNLGWSMLYYSNLSIHKLYLPNIPQQKPSWYEEEESFEVEVPEGLESLLEALEYLSQEGASWDDLHVQNLMMGRDGEVKVIDVGLFKLE